MNDAYSFASALGVSGYIQASAYAPSYGENFRAPAHANPKTLTVAISREAGIDAGAYARAIGELLGWSVWDHELLERIAARLGSDVRELESLDERHVGWIQESLEAFLLRHSVNQHTFALELRQVVEDLAAEGNCVIVGRGAPHILPDKSTLKVRIVAPLENRVAAFVKQTGIDDAAHAARELQKLDHERTRFVRDHFHKDALDPAGYDVVLNAARFSPTDCARLVLDLVPAMA